MGTHGHVVALVFAGGDPPERRDLDDLADFTDRDDLLVVAADSGLHHAQRLGVPVDVVVGDLDSVDPGALAEAETAGTTVERHSTAKDETDLELALRAAIARGATRVVVLGAAGGRIDHLLANALVLASDDLASLRIEARVAGARLYVVRDEVELAAEPGELLTLLPLGGPAQGVVTAGLRYPLRRETLHPGSTRGVSNEIVEPLVRVSLTAGALLAVLPGARVAVHPDADARRHVRDHREVHP